MKIIAGYNRKKALIIIFIIILLCITNSLLNNDNAEDKMTHSSSLRENIINDGNSTIIEYKDSNGKLTYANDKHFARCIKTQTGKEFLVEYYDEKGNPAKQEAGYYALKTKHNDNKEIEEITYLGVDHEPIMISTGYSIARYQYNDVERTKETRLYDTEGEPVQTYSFGYGCKERSNEKGEVISTTYIDYNGKPVIVGQGFAIKHMKYYDTGDAEEKVEYVYYYDENEQPMPINLGQYGIHIEYDELGRENKRTFLDENGQPTLTKLGYATVAFTRYEDDRIKTETYYDLNEEQVCLSEGQYGKQYTLDGKTQYLDINGKVMINLKQALYNNELLVVLSCVIIIIVSIIANKKINYVLLATYLFAIIYMTILYRNTSDITDTGRGIIETLKKLYKSHESRMGLFNNILLFIPLGTIVFRLYSRPRVIIIPILISILIETIQHFAGIGYGDFLDVISNSIGGVVGYCVGEFLCCRTAFSTNNIDV